MQTKHGHMMVMTASASALLLFALFFHLFMKMIRVEGLQQTRNTLNSMGPPLRKDDLPVLDMGTAYRPTSQHGLDCKGRTCTFGIYRLVGEAPGGAVTFELSTHLAGGVYRVTYKGKEFVNPVAIVGASMQTATVYDEWGSSNPTEGGTGDLDSFTEKSSSRMLELRGNGTTAVYTAVQAANFNQPGKKLKWGKTTGNTTVLSDTLMAKRIEHLGDGVFEYTVGITIPASGRHWYMLPEVLCCWTPREQAAVMQVLRGGSWHDAPDKPAQLYFADTVGPKFPRHDGFVTATRDGTAAMGVKIMDWPRGRRFEHARYGTPESKPTWRKWSVTQRLGDAKGNDRTPLPAGQYTWKIRLFFGDLRTVQSRVAASEKP